MGELLTNGNVIDIFHACFRIGHYQPERSKGTTGGALHCSQRIRLLQNPRGNRQHLCMPRY